jgi:hypothetical protein
MEVYCIRATTLIIGRAPIMPVVRGVAADDSRVATVTCGCRPGPPLPTFPLPTDRPAPRMHSTLLPAALDDKGSSLQALPGSAPSTGAGLLPASWQGASPHPMSSATTQTPLPVHRPGRARRTRSLPALVESRPALVSVSVEETEEPDSLTHT